MGADRLPDTATGSIHDVWMLFFLEGAALVVLGVLAIIIPSIASSAATLILGWLFLASGVIGLVTTFRARHMPGFWWSLVSALLGILVGAVWNYAGTRKLTWGRARSRVLANRVRPQS